jgi:hypothetical protein
MTTPSTDETSWASVEDVAAITGKTVTDDQVMSAQFVIDLYSNRTPAASALMSNRDKVWLQRAVAYQVVWMLAQPDFYSRTQITKLAQDGLSTEFASKAALHLAPLAERALKNCSWLRSRSLRIRTPFTDSDLGLYGFTSEVNDIYDTWTSVR